jgi:hypothetical protein
MLNLFLLDRSSDYKKLLPLIIVVLKKYSANTRIRRHAFRMLYRACSTINDKKIIARSGVMEVLGSLLSSDNIGEVISDIIQDIYIYIYT